MSKLIIALAAYLTGILSLYAQVSEIRNSTPFSKIEVSDNVAVVLTESQDFSIIVEAYDQSTLNTVTTTIKNGKLTIARQKPGLPVKVMLSANSIKKINVGSNASLRLTSGFTQPKMEISLRDNAHFSGNLTVDRLYLSARENSELNVKTQSHYLKGNFEEKAKANISGFASSADLITANSAICNAKSFMANDITIKSDNFSSVLIQGIGYMKLNNTDANVSYLENLKRD